MFFCLRHASACANDVRVDLLAAAVSRIRRKYRHRRKTAKSYQSAELAVRNFKIHKPPNFFRLASFICLLGFLNMSAKLIIDYNLRNVIITPKMNLISSILQKPRSIQLFFFSNIKPV